MKVLSIFKKSLKENIRDWKILILTLIFGPFFVLLYFFWFGSASVNYHLIVANLDKGHVKIKGNIVVAGDLLTSKLSNYELTKDSHFIVSTMKDIEKAKQLIKNQDADVLIVFPNNLSSIIADNIKGKQNQKISFKYFGNMTNQKYPIATSISYSVLSEYVSYFSGLNTPTSFSEEFLEKRTIRNDFDYSIPGLIVLSVIMILFTAAASIIKEVDKGTIKRLKISNVSSFELIAGISIGQIIITVLSMALTIITALALGFKPAGSMLDVSIIGLLACFSVLAISLIVASLLKSIFDLMTIGCFPWFILAFFSGGMFPLPQIKLFSLFHHTFNLADILPTSHAVTAINKILNFGMDLGDLYYEMAMIIALTMLYFIIGIRLFGKRHFSTI
jgi:ABC-2 type transport system permease protein